MPSVNEWFFPVLALMASVSTLVIAIQLLLSFDLRRQENSLKILEMFDRMRTRDLNRQMLFLFDLPSDQKKHLLNSDTFAAPRGTVKKYFPELITNDNSGDVTLPYSFVTDVRFGIVTALNHIESIALAYVHGCADRVILNDALRQALIHESRRAKWEEVMNVFGPHSWPAIRDLCKLLDPATDTSRSMNFGRLFDAVIWIVKKFFGSIK